MKILSVLSSAAFWSSLRGIGNSQFAKATILMPIFGYLILFNEYFVRYLQQHHSLCPTTSCNVTWKFYFIYFGASAIGIGSMFYAILCPEVIKKYPGPADFFDKEKQYYCYPSHLAELIIYIEKQSGKPIHDVLRLKSQVDNNAVIGLNEAHVVSGLMGEKFSLSNASKAPARYFVLFFFTIGAVLISIPACITFFRILILSYFEFIQYFSI